MSINHIQIKSYSSKYRQWRIKSKFYPLHSNTIDIIRSSKNTLDKSMNLFLVITCAIKKKKMDTTFSTGIIPRNNAHLTISDN